MDFYVFDYCKKKIKKINYLRVLIFLFLLGLPYYLFKGQLLIGGDDSHLLYVFPKQFLQQVAITPWLHFSSVGTFTPNYFLIPILLIRWGMKSLIHNTIFIFYLFYSIPMILGFIFFQKFIKVLLRVGSAREAEIMIGSLVYILSPIIIVDQLSSFLYSVWLIALFPLLSYYWFQYQNSGEGVFLTKAILWSIPLSLAFFSIPWFLGMLIPLFLGLLSIFIFKKGISFLKIKRIIVFGLSIMVAQSFWFLPFVATFSNGLAAKASGSTISATVASTVEATSNGSIFTPLVDLPHRQIAFQFNWPLKQVFLSFYDLLSTFDLYFVVLLIVGLVLSRKYLDKTERVHQAVFLVALLISLFFFTVNVGPLKQIFLALAVIPGFAMFRNAFDKFAPGYVFIYSVMLTFSIITISRAIGSVAWRKRLFLGSIFLLVVINAIPIRQIIVHSLWTTKNVPVITTFPSEYTSFMKLVSKEVPPTTNILSVPLGSSLYSIVPNHSSGGVYAGRSPVQLLSGVNDFSGNFSFPSKVVGQFDQMLTNKEYNRLKSFLALYNINYVIITNNIPNEVLHSYLFSSSILKAQNKALFSAILGKKIAESNSGNYILYKTKQRGSLFSTPGKLLSLSNSSPARTSVNELQWLLKFINQGNNLVPQSLVPLNQKISYSLKPNVAKRIPKGKYTLSINNSNVGTLNYSNLHNTIYLFAGVRYKLGGVVYSPSKEIVATSVNPTTLVNIGGKIILASAIHNYSVRNGNNITIGNGSQVVSTVVKLPSAHTINFNTVNQPTTLTLDPIVNNDTNRIKNFNSWSQEDCADIGNTPVKLTTFKTTINAVYLEAKYNHNACIIKRVPANYNNEYTLHFEYKSNNQKNSMIILFPNGQSKVFSIFKTNGRWKNFTKDFQLPLGANKFTVYLYSGNSGKGVYQASYKDMSLSSVPLTYLHAFVLKHSSQFISPPQRTFVTHYSSIYNKVKIQGANKPFLLSFSESYNPGWKIYIRPIRNNFCLADKSRNLNTNFLRVQKKVKGTVIDCKTHPHLLNIGNPSFIWRSPVFSNKHVEVNAYGNGWLINPQYVENHFSSSYYHKNANGTINFDLVVYFQPQSYFYISVILSLIVICSSLGFLMYKTVLNHKFRKGNFNA